MPTKTKAKKKEILNTEENIIKTCTFDLKKIEMKDDFIWRMKLELKTRLSQSFREYSVRLSVNEEPFENRIADLERKEEELKSEKQLLEQVQKEQLAGIKDEIKEVESELAEMTDLCPTIEFDGTIEELKYKDGNTIVVLMFPYSTLNEINEKRLLLSDHYKIDLIRE
jgi:DNA repair exonuclease SbcCD ATPase subunit